MCPHFPLDLYFVYVVSMAGCGGSELAPAKADVLSCVCSNIKSVGSAKCVLVWTFSIFMFLTWTNLAYAATLTKNTDISCSKVRYFYASQGFSEAGFLDEPVTGKDHSPVPSHTW